MKYKIGDNIIVTELNTLHESEEDIIINSKDYEGNELKYYQQNLQGKTIYNKILGNIYLGSAGRKETGWRSRGKYLSIICFIDKIIETGYSNGLPEKPDHERVNDNIQNFYSIYNEVIYDSRPIGVTVIIYEDLMGRKYYMFKAYKQNENLVSNYEVSHQMVEESRQHQVNYIINEKTSKIKCLIEKYKEILRKENNMEFKQLTEKLKKYLLEPQDNIVFDDMEDETGMNKVEETLQKDPMILYTVYYNTDTPDTCGSVKVKASSEEDAIKKAKSYVTKKYPEADTFRIGANNNNSHIDIVEDVDTSLLKSDNRFRYMMLSRMKSDCDYFLGNGDGYEGHLWAGNVEDQIANMKALWDSFKEKPEWLSMEDIDDYEEQMLEKRAEKQGIREEATFAQTGTTPTPTFSQAKVMGKPVPGKKHKKDEITETIKQINKFLTKSLNEDMSNQDLYDIVYSRGQEVAMKVNHVVDRLRYRLLDNVSYTGNNAKKLAWDVDNKLRDILKTLDDCYNQIG